MTFHIPQAYIYLLTTYKRQPIKALKAIIHNNNTFAMATAEGAKRCSQRPPPLGILWAGWLLLPASKLWSTPAESISPESGHAPSTGFNQDFFNLALSPPGCWWWQHRGVTTSEDALGALCRRHLVPLSNLSIVPCPHHWQYPWVFHRK